MLAEAMLALPAVVGCIWVGWWSEAFTGAGLPITEVSAVFFIAVGHGSDVVVCKEETQTT